MSLLAIAVIFLHDVYKGFLYEAHFVCTFSENNIDLTENVKIFFTSQRIRNSVTSCNKNGIYIYDVYSHSSGKKVE